MKRFLDSSILVESCLANSPKFKEADRLLGSRGSVTSAHALAETYATLSGDPRLKIPPIEASRMVKELSNLLSVEDCKTDVYLSLIDAAPAKGVRGGSIYDALHAEIARRSGCDEVYTLNISHFRHVAPDLKVLTL